MPEGAAVIIEPGCERETRIKDALRVNLDEADSFFVVWNFLEFHNLIVVVDSFIV